MVLKRKAAKSLARSSDVPFRSPANVPDSNPPLPKVIGAKIHNPSGKKLLHYTKRPKHRAYNVVNPKYVFEETYYTVDPKTMQPTGFATLVPNYFNEDRPLVVAWDSCGTCHYYWTLCRCIGGIRTPRSVEYIRDKSDVTTAEGVDAWVVTHPKYYGSLGAADREARKLAQETRRTVDRARKYPEVGKPASKRLLRKTGSQTPPPLKRLSKGPSDTADEVLKGTELDRVALDKATARSTEQMVDQLRRGNRPRKMLKRKR